MLPHEHHRREDDQEALPLPICNLSFVSKKTVTAAIAGTAIAILSIATGIILNCNSDARDNGIRDTKINAVEKTQTDMLNTINKIADATSTKQAEILNAIDDLKRINGRKKP
jgi:hypothetical protein